MGAQNVQHLEIFHRKFDGGNVEEMWRKCGGNVRLLKSYE